MDSELLEELMIKLRTHHGSLPSSFLFAVVVDVVTELEKEGAVKQIFFSNK